jgi:hypothetical protein
VIGGTLAFLVQAGARAAGMQGFLRRDHKIGVVEDEVQGKSGEVDLRMGGIAAVGVVIEKSV